MSIKGVIVADLFSENTDSFSDNRGFREMTVLEYFCGLALFLLGFNLGIYEAGKGIAFDDLKQLWQSLKRKIIKKEA